MDNMRQDVAGRLLKMIEQTNEITVPWAGSGVDVSNASSIEDVMETSGLNWKVEGRPLFTTMGSIDNVGSMMGVATHKAIVRATDEEIMGIVGNKWNILQNHEVFSFVDDLQKLGLVKYRNAGQFKGGRVVWVQAEFQESEIVPGDVHKKYLMLTNAFDGTFSVRIGWTDTRVACWNTFMVAARDARNGVAIKHTAAMRDKIDEARQALVLAESQARQLDMFQKSLAGLRMTGDMWRDFSNKMIPDPEEGKNKTRAENARAELVALSITGRGQDIPGVEGTAYAALSALTEYVNYHRTARGKDDLQRQAGRFQNTLFGSGYKMINGGIDVLNGYLVDHGIQVSS